MAENQGRSATKCPTCGAPLAEMEDERCQYCGSPIRADVAATKYAVREAERLSKRAWRRSWVYVLAFTGLSSLLAFFGQWRATNKARTVEQTARPAVLAKAGVRPPAAAERERLEPATLLGSVVPPDGKAALLFATRRGPDYPLLLIDAATGKVRWRQGAFGAEVRKLQIAFDDGKIFVPETARLTALASADGSVLWRASLMADYREYADAVRASGGRVAVLLRDGTTQAFDAASGKTVWTHRRTPPPNRLAGAGDSLVEFVRLEKKRGYDEHVAIVDLGTGAERHGLRPRCSTHSVIPANEPSSSSPLVFSPDGEEMYLFYGFNRFCVERWSLRTGSLAWQINRHEAGEASLIGGSLETVLGSELLFYPANDGVYAIKRKGGDLRKVVADPENRLSPVLTDDKLLVVAATPTWEHSECAGAKSCSLWGVDVAKGTVLWRYALPAQTTGGHRNAGERFAARLDADRLSLALAHGADLILDHVDRDTGVVRFHQALTQDSEVRRLEFRDGLLWVEARDFVAVDPQTGASPYRLQ